MLIVSKDKERDECAKTDRAKHKNKDVDMCMVKEKINFSRDVNCFTLFSIDSEEKIPGSRSFRACSLAVKLVGREIQSQNISANSR